MKKAIIIVCICLLLFSETLAGVTNVKDAIMLTNEMPLSLLCNTDEYDLLVIAPDKWMDDLEPLKQHKENHLISTIIVGLKEIYEETYFPVTGRDEAEKIKYFIKHALDEWGITYVLLVGGRKHWPSEKWHTPVRYVENKGWGLPTYLCDLYFADIYNETGVFQSWDTNDDDVFGTKNDDMDLHPDVYVGRWACRNKIEVKTMVKKTIEYESQSEKMKKIVLIGGDTFEDPGTDYDEGELITNESGNCLPGYEVAKVFSSEKSVSPEEIKRALGTGATFMHFSGHGYVIYWNTYEHNEINTVSELGLGIWDIPLFFNKQYPIVVIGGCRTGMFNVAVTYHPKTWFEDRDLPIILKFFPAVESISWFFNRKISGGSIASLGYSCSPVGGTGESRDWDNDGMTEPDCIEIGYGFMEINFFYAHGIEGLTYLGECWGYAENTYIDTIGAFYPDLWTIQGFVLFGDPSLKIGGYDSMN